MTFEADAIAAAQVRCVAWFSLYHGQVVLMLATQKRPLAQLVAVLLLSSGCSVLMSHAPVHYEPNRGPPECMRAPVAPALDLLAVPGALLIGAIVNTAEAMLSDCETDDCDPPASSGDKWFIMAGVLGASSMYGFVQTGRCNEAHARYRDYREAGGATLAPEPEPVSAICRVWQRRYHAATTVDEKREVMRKAAPECLPLLDLWPAGRSSR